jgi:DNA invertase Pin-like site-specific DNA recombinase/DNA-binding transcriptional MerR regulator
LPVRLGRGGCRETFAQQLDGRQLTRRGGLVAPAHDAVGTGDHERALGKATGVQHVKGSARGALGLEVRQLLAANSQLLLERALRPGRVARDAVQGISAQLELASDVLVQLQLIGAHGAEHKRYRKHMTTERRAIGIIRVSQTNGRDGESFASPGEQRERIEAACKRDGLKLVQVFDEMDVSGGTSLERRTGLRTAVETVEAGQAEVVVAAYFDRLVRSLKVQTELVERVEAAGGEVLALDVGQVTEGTAGQWLSGTMLGAVSEYQRRTTRERTGAAQRRAVERGVPPLANIPPGYRRGEDGRLVVEPREAPIVAEAFKLRASGASIKEVRAFMQTHGIERTWRSTQTTLASPIVLGEIHFGEMVNLEAHPAIVGRETFQRVQKMIVPRGRRAVSDRLLARLGVLRCGTCGGKMIVGSRNNPNAKRSPNGKDARYPMYRCSPTGDCPQRVAISAVQAEGFVVERVRELLADSEGRASAQENIRDAERQLATARDALDAAVRAFDGLGDLEAARDRLQELRAAVDAAQARVDQLGPGDSLSIDGARDWDKLAVEGKRALIRATIESATVAPGRGADRLTIQTR